MITDMFNRRTLAKMETALDKTCDRLQVGQDHSVRQTIAAGLIESAKEGRSSQAELSQTADALARQILAQLRAMR